MKVISLMFLALLCLSCGGKSVPTGRFLINKEKSVMVLGTVDFGSIAEFSPDGEVKVQGAFQRRWDKNGSVINIEVPKPNVIVRMMQNLPIEGSGPVKLSWTIEGPDELRWSPPAFKGKLVLVYTRIKGE